MNEKLVKGLEEIIENSKFKECNFTKDTCFGFIKDLCKEQSKRLAKAISEKLEINKEEVYFAIDTYVLQTNDLGSRVKIREMTDLAKALSQSNIIKLKEE